MLSPEVRPIGESSNDDSSHRHDGSDVASDQESSVPIAGAIIIVGVAAIVSQNIGGEGGIRSSSL